MAAAEALAKECLVDGRVNTDSKYSLSAEYACMYEPRIWP